MALITNNIIKVFLSAPIQLWWIDNVLYKRIDGVTVKYNFITKTAWELIKTDALKGSTYSLDAYTQYETFEYYDGKIPRGAEKATIAVSDSIDMFKVESSNVEYVGYDIDNQYLYVLYKGSQQIYRYSNVTPDIWEGLKYADSKGSFLHFMVKINFDFEVVDKANLFFTDEWTPNTGHAHPDGYMTGF